MKDQEPHLRRSTASIPAREPKHAAGRPHTPDTLDYEGIPHEEVASELKKKRD